MAKCRKNGCGKKMEDEEIQELQHQQQRQHKEQSNSNDEDQSRPPDTVIASVADDEPLQAPVAAPTVATVAVPAPADPHAALLGAIRSRDIVGGVDPRKAMLSAIEARRKD